jgi:hypothetical protein
MQPGFWRKCCVCFRWCRIGAWLVLLATICALLWVNRIGLPDFLKERLVKTLHDRGLELEFTRMRLHMTRGIVAENIRIGHAQAPDSLVLSLAEAQLQFNFRALLHRRLQIDGLVLRQGKFVWQFSPTNALTLQNIQTDLRFQTNDSWSLDNFHADFAGAKLALSGDIAHAPELRNWDIFRRKKTGATVVLQQQLQIISDALPKIHFAGAPQLTLVVDGDARDIHSFAVRLNINAAGAQTPWFSGRNIQLVAQMTAPGTATNFDSSWGFWTNMEPYQLVWSARFAELRSKGLDADSVSSGGFWRAPELAVTNLSAMLGGGKLNASAKLNVATREFIFTNSSDFDFHAVASLLTEKTRGRLADFSWTQPPSLQAGGSLILPAWTNRQPDWEDGVRPTVRLDGALAFTNGSVRGAAIDSANTHFSYSNLVWRLPDLALARAKTKLALSGGEDDTTRNYRWHIRGALDPEVVRPFLTASNAARGLEILKFNEPLALDMTVNGRLYDYDSIAANGSVALTNFAVRGEVFGDVASAVNYTNRVLEFLHPLMHTGAQMATADKIILDFNTRMIYFTNGFTIADPEPVARAIGPKTGRIVAPYHFLQPPTARVNGQIPLHDMNSGRDMAEVDMRFDILRPAPFQWSKLQTPGIMGTIRWRGQTLVLTNVTAAFYGGSGNGFANFDFRAAHAGADYQFAVNVTNVNLHLLSADLSSRTNRLEGALAGTLVVTDADTRDWRTWNGYGHAHLRDGLLWDIPIFGILSPVLNTVSPGLGNSRATDASARFSITNGVIYTDSLEIRSLMARLDYAGTADLQGNVNAQVTAQLLRDTLVVGPLISTMLWPVSKLFEYKITGTLANPKSDPVYVIPKLLLMPLHPIRSIEQMFPAGDGLTNAPADY